MINKANAQQCSSIDLRTGNVTESSSVDRIGMNSVENRSLSQPHPETGGACASTRRVVVRALPEAGLRRLAEGLDSAEALPNNQDLLLCMWVALAADQELSAGRDIHLTRGDLEGEQRKAILRSVGDAVPSDDPIRAHASQGIPTLCSMCDAMGGENTLAGKLGGESLDVHNALAKRLAGVMLIGGAETEAAWRSASKALAS